jgi:hypothetical protein
MNPAKKNNYSYETITASNNPNSNNGKGIQMPKNQNNFY